MAEDLDVEAMLEAPYKKEVRVIWFSTYMWIYANYHKTISLIDTTT